MKSSPEDEKIGFCIRVSGFQILSMRIVRRELGGKTPLSHADCGCRSCFVSYIKPVKAMHSGHAQRYGCSFWENFMVGWKIINLEKYPVFILLLYMRLTSIFIALTIHRQHIGLLMKEYSSFYLIKGTTLRVWISTTIECHTLS